MAPAPAAVSSSVGHGGLPQPRNINTGRLLEGSKAEGGRLGRAGLWSRVGVELRSFLEEADLRP